MVTEEDLTLSGEHTVQYADDVPQIVHLKIYKRINQYHPNKFYFKKPQLK